MMAVVPPIRLCRSLVIRKTVSNISRIWRCPVGRRDCHPSPHHCELLFQFCGDISSFSLSILWNQRENLVQLTRISIDVSGSAISDVFGGARCHVGRIDVDVGWDLWVVACRFGRRGATYPYGAAWWSQVIAEVGTCILSGLLVHMAKVVSPRP